MSYQVRSNTGGTRELNSAQELLEFKDMDYVGKISFNGPDGARIRLLRDDNTFIFTIWSEKEGNYVNVLTGLVE